MNLSDKKQAKQAKRLQARQARNAGKQAQAESQEQSELNITGKAIAYELMNIESANENTETLFLSIALRMPAMTTAHDEDEKYIKDARDAVKPLREAVWTAIMDAQDIEAPKNRKDKPALEAFRKLKNGKLKMLDNARADIITVYVNGLEDDVMEAIKSGTNSRTAFTTTAKEIRDAFKGTGDLTAHEAEALAEDVWASFHRAFRALNTLNLDAKDASKFVSLAKQHALDSEFPTVTVKALDECTDDVEEDGDLEEAA